MTSPYGSIEQPFNLVSLAASAGATDVARWTTLHVRRLTEAIKKGMQKKGFAFIEVIAPCPTVYGRYNRLGDGLDMMKALREHTVIRNGVPPTEATILPDKEILLGEFLDIEKPEYTDMMRALVEKTREKREK
jgi:2-oxoglutarate ferredoxin oxidoreductase subunit beta